MNEANDLIILKQINIDHINLVFHVQIDELYIHKYNVL